MIHRIDEPPRVLVRLDVPAPRERLIADDHARRLRRARERRRAGRSIERVVADRVRRNVAARQHAIRAEFMHQVELALRALEIARETLRA